MPPRRRRAGAREGNLSASLKLALQREANSLGRIGAAVDRVRAVNDFYAQIDLELEQIAEVRYEAVRELQREGMSYGQIAEATGLSKPRVQQLVNKAAEAAG